MTGRERPTRPVGVPTPPNAPTVPTVEVRIDVPASLHRQVKVRAAQDGLTVKGAMLAALDDWVTPAKHKAPATPSPAEQDRLRAEGGQVVFDIVDRGLRNHALPEAKAEIVAYLDSLTGAEA